MSRLLGVQKPYPRLILRRRELPSGRMVEIPPSAQGQAMVDIPDISQDLAPAATTGRSDEPDPPLQMPEMLPRARHKKRRASPASQQRLVVVSNRVPEPKNRSAKAGGLTVALEGALKQSGGLWFGWSG